MKYYSLKKIDRLFVDRDNVNFAKIKANKKLFTKLNPKYNIKTLGELKYILNNGCDINISKCYCGKKKRFISNKQGYTKFQISFYFYKYYQILFKYFFYVDYYFI